MPVLTSPLARAFEGPHNRAAEAAVADWLLSPELGALKADLASMSLASVRELGATLESLMLLGVAPASKELAEAVRLAAAWAHPSREAGTSVQHRWGVHRLAFDPARLRQRLQESSALLDR
ncbi:hypothetical protein LMG667_04675 [Xanthomonas euvesicatoria]|uniref:hypothetical protein n=1 Tax=Xanthomonas euvesicatoria TaxID=456327 RepID=UPI00080E951C|nr:hypothetical protein [Xanthomonas euvesicatoria]OCG89380.1 hypothetical protein LMG667_04675 [Xanthomonas euvesicatoria]